MPEANGIDEAPIARIHAVVRGLVQGVNFRAYTVREARQLELVGWVHNRPDGTVETEAEGPREKLERFAAFLQVGSPSASVREVSVTWQAATGANDAFVVRYF